MGKFTEWSNIVANTKERIIFWIYSLWLQFQLHPRIIQGLLQNICSILHARKLNQSRATEQPVVSNVARQPHTINLGKDKRSSYPQILYKLKCWSLDCTQMQSRRSNTEYAYVIIMQSKLQQRYLYCHLVSRYTLACWLKNDSTSSSLISYSRGEAAIVLSSNCLMTSSGFASSVTLPTFVPEQIIRNCH